MKFELWDVVSMRGEGLTPLTLIDRAEDFTKIYHQFLDRMPDQPCVIIASRAVPDLPVVPPPSDKKIYESPDGGNTVYERSFGNTKDRKRIK